MMIFLLFILSISMKTLYGLDILFIGDSHSVGIFGREFDRLLRQGDDKIETYAICGSTLKWWYDGKETKCGYFFKDRSGKIEEGYQIPKKTPLLVDLIKKSNPQLIIVQLGTNWWNEKQENIKKEIDKFFEIIGERKCYWIGPPKSRKLYIAIESIDKFLKENISKRCTYFDSLMITDYPSEGGDGIHYSATDPYMKEIAIRWANASYNFYFNQE